jgi:phosphatidate cytidylyltransferase
VNASASASGLRQRALTAIVLAPIGIAAVLMLPTPGFALLLGALFAIGLWEWANLAGSKSAPMRALYATFGIAAMLALWWLGREVQWQAAWVGLGFWLIAPLWLAYFDFGSALKRRFVSLKLVAGILAIVPAWAAGIHLHGGSAQGAAWVLFVVVLIWCADVFAYFSGRQFGGRKLAPRISPGKTWAGAYGGFVGAALYALICGLVIGLRGVDLLALMGLSALTVALSVMGDLFESLIKRHSGEKDSGQLFPGHGGALDRFDSLFAALPLFTVGKALLGL